MDLKSGITSKTKLPQQQWSHLHNIDIKCHTMSYSIPLEIFFYQDDGNFYMWEESSVMLQKNGSFKEAGEFGLIIRAKNIW